MINGEGLVFLHGAGSRGDVWQLQLLAFPQAEAPDLPGRDGEAPQTLQGYVDALRPTLTSATVVAGHSLGGAIAMQYALEAPPGLRGLILVGTGARLRVRPDWLQQLEEDYPAVTADLVEHFYAPTTPERFKQRSLETMRQLSPAVTRADFLAADGLDVRDRLGGIVVPTLIICGSLDVMTPPRYAEFLHAHLPRAHLVVIEGAGHMVMLERPQEVNEAVREFLRGLTG